MDFEIQINILKNKQTEFEEMRSKVDTFVDECQSKLKVLNRTEISSLSDNIKQKAERVKTSYNNSSEWLSNYLSELNELESSLANFSCSNMETPIEFSGKFEDMFGKVLIPTLKTGGDKKANLGLAEMTYLANSSYAVTPHSLIDSETRAARIALCGGECGSEAEQNAKMETIQVPYWNGQEESTMNITVNRSIVDNYRNAFAKLAKMKYTVLPEITGAYDYYHTPRPSGAPSDHTLGTALDINWDHNWNTGDGSEHSVRGKEDVIAVFASEGFYWGGDWSNPDDMHFCFTGY